MNSYPPQACQCSWICSLSIKTKLSESWKQMWPTYTAIQFEKYCFGLFMLKVTKGQVIQLKVIELQKFTQNMGYFLEGYS